jgi:hypothetical protein
MSATKGDEFENGLYAGYRLGLEMAKFCVGDFGKRYRHERLCSDIQSEIDVTAGDEDRVIAAAVNQ